MTDVLEETRVKDKARRLGVGAVLAAGPLLFAATMKWQQLPVIDRMGRKKGVKAYLHPTHS